MEIMGRFRIQIVDSLVRQCQFLVRANVRNCSAVGSLLVLICADALRADGECGGPSWRILRCSRSRPRSIGTYELLRRASSAMNALLMKAASALHMAKVISADVIIFSPREQHNTRHCALIKSWGTCESHEHREQAPHATMRLGGVIPLTRVASSWQHGGHLF